MALLDTVRTTLTSKKPTYPPNHKPGMIVPEGGSSCSKCEYLAKNQRDCTNKYFIRWHGSPRIPGPITRYCSDWFDTE